MAITVWPVQIEAGPELSKLDLLFACSFPEFGRLEDLCSPVVPVLGVVALTLPVLLMLQTLLVSRESEVIRNKLPGGSYS